MENKSKIELNCEPIQQHSFFPMNPTNRIPDFQINQNQSQRIISIPFMVPLMPLMYQNPMLMMNNNFLMINPLM